MKIVILGPAHPFRGGIAALNESLAKTLQKEGHEVVMYTFTIQYPNFLFPGKTQFTDDPKPKELNIKRAISSVNPMNWFNVGRELKALEADLIITRYWIPFMGPCLGTIIKQAKKNRKTKVICIADNIIPHESKPGDKQFTQYFVKQVDGFLAMSQSVLNDIGIFDQKKPRVFNPHPIYDHYGELMERDAALNHLGLDTNYEYLLFFGLIRGYKGLDLLLDAISDARIRNKKIKLIVAGEYYADKAPYMEQIEKHGIKDMIIEVDQYIPDAEVKYYFNACDLLVQPYKTATQSGVTQIAYHFNKPMVVTDVGGLGEMIPNGKSGYVVQPDPTAIADGIISYFENTDRQQMLVDLKKEKERFSWNKLTETIFGLYHKI